jgi:predicted CXXCH cytochrome family protein
MVLIFLTWALCFLSANLYAARVVAEKRECATCHIAWMADFKREDVTTLIPHNPRPKEKTGRQDVVSTERMCFSCHDGFALDSRFFWQGGHSHPVGVKPSDKVIIPTDGDKVTFPLNDEGNIYCGTCHSAHGTEWGDKLSPVFLRARNIESSLCIMCHADRKGEMDGRQNHPLKKNINEDTQSLSNAGSKFGKNNSVTCQSCHRVHSAKEKKLLVERNSRSQLCISCHKDKNPQSTTKGAKHFTHPINITPRSATIPDQFEKAGSKFGPKNEILCETCHQVHHAASAKLVLLDQDSLKDGICITCHESQRGLLDNGHNMFISREKKVKDMKISSMTGACGACHNIHGGEGPKMWARKLDNYGDRTASLCISCHKKGQLAEDFTVGQYSHPVGAEVPNGVDVPNELPLFTSTGEQTSSNQYGLISCPTCHDVHKPSSSKKLFSFFGNSDGSSGKYLRIGEQEHISLCKNCHQDKWTVTKTKHNVENIMEDEKSDALGVCGSCHLVHNGLGPRMWARDNITIQTDTTSLCLSCHAEGALAEDKTVGKHSHPVGVSIENVAIQITKGGWVVKEGDDNQTVPPSLPLYNDKGIKQKSSDLVGCGTCHDPHRWYPAMTNDSPQSEDMDGEGNSRNSFLRISASPDGQLCTTCHRSKGTINATDHDMSVTAPDTTNVLDANPMQTGVCGQCHAVHNANQDLALWARQPGQGQDAAEMLCRSCHSDGEVAQAKNPKIAHHPSYVSAWSSELRKSIDPNIESIPMFSGSGRQSDIGFISCPTCHNPHQWQANSDNKGNGENEEGDVLSSFLRLQTTEGFICADCHGLDSLFRYKYFHGEALDKPQ